MISWWSNLVFENSHTCSHKHTSTSHTNTRTYAHIFTHKHTSTPHTETYKILKGILKNLKVDSILNLDCRNRTKPRVYWDWKTLKKNGRNNKNTIPGLYILSDFDLFTMII